MSTRRPSRKLPNALTVNAAGHDDTHLPAIDTEQSLTNRFRLVTSAHGRRLAISDGARKISYQELDRESDLLASLILGTLDMSQRPVGLLFPQSAESIISILAVLKSGNTYVPLDPSDTPQRLSYIVQSADCPLVVTGQRHIHLAKKIAAMVPAGVLDVTNRNMAGNYVTLPVTTADDIAYIFFTSGTTGEPKGVFDSHRNVAHNVLRYTETLQFRPRDRMSLVQAPSFSGTVSTIFGALLNGASLFPYDTKARGLLAISSWLKSNEISIYHSVPALFRLVFEDRDVSPALRLVRLEGDRATTGDLRLMERTNSSAQLVNGLGTTETGLVTQFFPERGFNNRNGVLPAGQPVRDMAVSIVDETGSHVEDGETGLVAVTGKYLALGYLRRGTIHQNDFHTNEDGGRTYLTQDLGVMRVNGLELLGRRGRCARMRGTWVDLTEIEAAILSLEKVFDAIVRIGVNRRGEERLEAYVVPNGQLDEAGLRSHISKRVPSYMIPEMIALVDQLPVTASGKIDHDALWKVNSSESEPYGNPAAGRGDSNGFVLRTISKIWTDELSSGTIGDDDNFFLFGGTSLALARIHSRVEKAFGLKLQFEYLLGDLTIRRMADLVVNQRSRQKDRTGVVCLRESATSRPIFCFHTQTGSYLFYGILAAWLNTDVAVYAFGVEDPETVAPPRNDFATIASRYLDEVKKIQPSGPYRLVGNCMGCLIAYEIAVQLQEAGETVDTLVLLDDTLPYFEHTATSQVTPDHFVRAARSGRLRARVSFHFEKRLKRNVHRIRRSAEFIRSAEGRRRARIARCLKAARRQYCPATYDGLLTLVRGDVDPKANQMHCRQWRNVAAHIRCITFSGHEDDMFRLPEVREVAHIVDTILAESELGG